MNMSEAAGWVETQRPVRRNNWVDGSLAYQPAARLFGEVESTKPLYLDANEGSCDSFIYRSLAAKIAEDPQLLSGYPSVAALEARLARRYGIAADRVVVCTGGDDAIQRIVSRCVKPADKVLVYEPAFSMYEVYTKIRGASIVALPWYEADVFPLPSSLELIERCPSLALVCLATPANPVGNVASPDAVRQLAAACARNGRNLLLDTAYEDFCEQPCGREMAQAGNCFIVGTFSKFWGLAGLRVGWAIAPDADSARQLRAAGGPYPVSAPALVAAELALDNEAVLLQRSELLKINRSKLAQRLEDYGFRVFSSQTNFVFARGERLSDLRTILADAAIFFRSWQGTAGLEDALRITVPAEPSDCQRLFNVLETMEADV